MQVYALVDAGDPEAADVFLSEADAQRALDDCLFDEPEWHGLPRVVPSSRRELSSRRTDVIAVGLRFSRRP
ncbi:MAG TPA: hypothetical protein VEH52_07945, partial [Gaiellaceae bacterium]|nr:hypothetical protein [Gaiellaceae bacterium]